MRPSFFRHFAAVLLACVVLGPAWSQTSGSNAWTLQRCLEHALEHNLQLKQAELGIVRGELGELAAKGAFLPNLNASSSYGVNIGQRIDPFTNTFATDAVQSSNYGMSSGVTLFNGFQNHLNLRRARLGLELAQTNVEIAQNNVALSLASGYLNVLFQKEFLTIAQLNAEATGRQVDRVQKLVNAGAAAESDLYDVLAQQASDVSSVVAAENGVTLAKLALAQLLQLSGDDADALDVAPPSDDLLETTQLPLSADAAVAFARNAFPDMKAAELQVTDAYLGLDLAKAQRMPRVAMSYSLGSGFSQNRQTMVGTPDTTLYFIETNDPMFSLVYPDVNMDNVTFETMSFQDQFTNNLNQSIFFSLSVPIFNNFGIHTNIERAEVDVLSAKLAKDQTEQALTQTVEQAYADARAAQRTFEANDRALEAAQLALTNAEARFEAGAISALEYADARTRLDNARINALRTQYDFVFKTRILDFYLGRPLSL
ncbi:MAG: TolC family protein [Bacteroidetes bacterium]|nr:TolC family protein [Bacteroidota bacterium]